MTLNSSKQTSILHRREVVARLRLRGLTQREIAMKLILEGVVNSATGDPFSIGTVNGDVKALEKQWRQQAAADTAALKGQVLAELRETRRAAWEDNQFTIVLRSIDQEIHLLGLDVPAFRIPPASPETPPTIGGRHADPLGEEVRMAMDRATAEEREALTGKLESLLADVASLAAKPQTVSDKKL